VWCLVVLLVGASVLLAFSREDDRTFPSLTSNRPSGTAAFARLLAEADYQVRGDRDPAPRLRLDEVAVAFIDESNDGGEAFDAALDRHLKRGGRALVIFVDEQLPNLASETTAVEITRQGEPAETLRLRPSPDFNYLPETEDPILDLWTDSEDLTTVARLVAKGEGARLEVATMAPFANRFLDLEGNAAFALDVLGTIAGDRKRVVFLEAAFGNAYRVGLARAVGPWLAALQTQAIVLFLVIVYSLGKSFGIVREQPRPESGARELLDGLAEVMRRGRKADAAWRMVALYGMTLARRRARLGADAPDSAVLDSLPDDWRIPLERRDATGLRPREAAALAHDLTEAIERSGRL
jgi:hypothetical protein